MSELTGLGWIAIGEIVIGERVRRDLGDLDDLTLSIKEHGVLSPITLLPGNRLLAGMRRLEAAKAAGLERVPYVVASVQDDAISILKAERDENTCRKPMTTSELVELGRQLEDLERPKAEERRQDSGRTSGRGMDRSESRDSDLSDMERKPPSEVKPRTESRTNAKVAEALGISESTYMRAKHLVKVAESDGDEFIRKVAGQCLLDVDQGALKVASARKRIARAKEHPELFNADTGAPIARNDPSRVQNNAGSRRKQIAGVDAAVAGIAGYCVGLSQISELDSSVTAEEAARLTSSLNKSLSSLTGFRKLLKERTA